MASYIDTELFGIGKNGAVQQMNACVEPLLIWYRKSARVLPWRSDPQPYHVWLSEIMLQQTRVEAVLPYYCRFLEAIPDVSTLAAASEEQLHKLWEGLGYYSRVRNLQKAARQVMERYDGILPPTYELLLDLCGIGEYTAGAIASIAFGVPVPAVDGNVLRVMSRLFASEADVTKPQAKTGFRDLLLDIIPRDRPGDFNQAMMELGATVCLPNGAPLCQACPLSAFCSGYRQGNPLLYPVKPEKKARRIEEKTVFVVQTERGILLHKRPEQGLLAGLWEFPNKEGYFTKKQAEEYWKDRGMTAASIFTLKPAKHIFTHVEWRMKGYFVAGTGLCLREGEAFAQEDEITDRYTIPNAFSAYKRGLAIFLKE